MPSSREDPTFDVKHFIAGARAAYEMIVTAYAEGDRRTLKNLLSREVYDGFEAAIRERETKGETVETRFVSIDKSDITAAEVRGRTAQVTVRFVSQLVSVTRDKIRQRDRRQSRQGHRRDRRLDVRARSVVARSQLEAGRDRSRALTGRRRDGAALSLCSAASAARRTCCWLAGPAGGPSPADRAVHVSGKPARTGDMDRLDGWAADDHLAAFTAFLTSCQPFLKESRPRDPRPVAQALGEVCRRAAAVKPATAAQARAFFEENFRPVRITKLGERGRLPDRLLRADRAGLALPQPGIPRPALPAPARPRRTAVPSAGDGFPQQGRADRPAQRARARSCPIPTAARSRPARSTARISRSAG